MRIAFSGTHRTGKTTLVEAVARHLPRYQVCDEPYRELEDEGYELSDPPAVEDFEHQLRRSIATLVAAPADVLLDRCPLDFVAYLESWDDFDLDDWIDALRDSVGRLGLIVVVPIERPDRVVVPSDEVRLRRLVDQRLRPLILDDPHGFEVATLEVTGTVAQRADQVLHALTARSR